MLAARHAGAPGGYHFVEDKMSTLEKVRGGGCRELSSVGLSVGHSNVHMPPAQVPRARPSAPSPPPQVATLGPLSAWQLYLVEWGYNTAAERQRAAANPRIEVVNLARFEALAGAA